jgi:SSS family solute:Na+ symporter
MSVAGFAILPLYLCATVGIGWASRQRASSANDFLNATGSQPFWVVAAAFFAANCGALEIIGLSAVAAQYGVQAFHFYWIGAIPGLVLLSAVMMPIYLRTGVRSLPEYLERRYSPRLRLLNAWLILVTVTGVAAMGVYAIAQVLAVVFHWPFTLGASLAAAVVLIYVLLGGLRATIYNEAFQLLVIVAGLIPLVILVRTLFPETAAHPDSHWHLWQGLPAFSTMATLDRFGVIVGLAFVLSVNYWCTDFVQIQRALTVRNLEAGRMVPLVAGFGKLGFSFLVVFPALGAAHLLGSRMPQAFDQTLPVLMAVSYGPFLLGLGLTALLASLMSGLAANVSAFASLWTEEIYRTSIRTGAEETHYILAGRVAILVSILLSIAASYLAFYFRDLMEMVQMIFALFGAPFLAILGLGFFTRRATASGAAAGLVSGVLAAAAFHLLAVLGWLTHGSQMSANFYSAICAFAASLGVGLLCSRKQDRMDSAKLKNLVYGFREIRSLLPTAPAWWILASTLLTACALLNYLWR